MIQDKNHPRFQIYAVVNLRSRVSASSNSMIQRILHYDVPLLAPRSLLEQMHPKCLDKD